MIPLAYMGRRSGWLHTFGILLFGVLGIPDPFELKSGNSVFLVGFGSVIILSSDLWSIGICDGWLCTGL